MAEETMRCPRRDENPSSDQVFPGPDHWRAVRNPGGGMIGDNERTCSYCGSMHPDDFMAIAAAGTAELGPTDKSYKVYVEHDGFHGKFYFQHLSEDQRREFVDVYNARPKRLYSDTEYEPGTFGRPKFTLAPGCPETGMAVGYPGHFYRLPFFMTSGR
jgi:hypothetical protein